MSPEAKSEIISDLRAGGLTAEADAMTDAILREARTEEALRLAYQEQNRRDLLRTRDQVTAFAIQFATVDLPILAATTLLSCGTLSAAAATWRFATGLRLAQSVIWAGEIAVSIPIGNAIDRALGRSVDDSFVGVMKQAGMMIGTRAAFYVLGEVGYRALGMMRSNLQLQFRRPVSVRVNYSARNRVNFRSPGARVRQRADTVTTELNRRGQVLDSNGTVVGSRDVTQVGLTADDLMALSERHNREYALITYRDGTQWLYSGRIAQGEVSTLAGSDIVRTLHTEPGLRMRGDRWTVPPSRDDVVNFLAHRRAGGGGNLEIIVREQGTGRVVTNSYSIDEARRLALLYGLSLVE